MIELNHFTYNVRSDFDEEKVSIIFERLKKEMEYVNKTEPLAAQRDKLLLAALNLTQKMIDLENENAILSELFNIQ